MVDLIPTEVRNSWLVESVIQPLCIHTTILNILMRLRRLASTYPSPKATDATGTVTDPTSTLMPASHTPLGGVRVEPDAGV